MQVLKQNIKSNFPAFGARPNTIFFDNSATTQKPARVIQSMLKFYEAECVNPGRGISALATKGRMAIESTREKVAGLLGSSSQDIAFTYGATDSLNLVAQSWGLANLTDGDEIMLCMDDHRSATLPWLNLINTLQRLGKHVKVVPFSIHDVGDYDLKSIKQGVSSRTRLLAMTHVHHVYGLEMEVKEIRELVGPDVAISLDASQSIGHMPVHVVDLPVDFISFSGHKMFAPSGIGVLWVHRRRQEEMLHQRIGGGSNITISEQNTLSMPAQLNGICEGGTYNAPAIFGLGEAVDFIQEIGLDTIESHVSELTLYLHDRLKSIPGIEFAPGIGVCGCRHGYGILSFRFAHAESADVAFMLDNEDILVRAGNFCHGKTDGGDPFIRVSMHIYNTQSEVDRLVDVLQEQL